MPTLREFFITEAADVIGQLNKLLQRLDGGSQQFADLQRHSRTLRGSAQMAREDRVYRAALGLEHAAKTIATGALAWSEDLSARIRRTIEDIDALVRAEENEDDANSRVKRTLDRWREIGLSLPDEGGSQPAQVSEASRQFRQFAAHEVSGIIAEMEVSLETLATDPRNRDPLKAILRRQRALLGAARLDEVSVVAEALRATEDMTRVIAKLNVPVKEEWLQVFKASRDVLRSALEPLQKGETPGPTPALSKLRTLRQELLDRYGETDNTPQATAQPAAPPMAPAPPPPGPPPQTAVASSDGIVGIEQLQYSGHAALKRALELKSAVATGDRDAVEEVFDLIQLGLA